MGLPRVVEPAPRLESSPDTFGSSLVRESDERVTSNRPDSRAMVRSRSVALLSPRPLPNLACALATPPPVRPDPWRPPRPGLSRRRRAAAIGAIYGSAIPLTRALSHPWQYAVLAGALLLLLLLRRGVVLTPPVRRRGRNHHRPHRQHCLALARSGSPPGMIGNPPARMTSAGRCRSTVGMWQSCTRGSAVTRGWWTACWLPRCCWPASGRPSRGAASSSFRWRSGSQCPWCSGGPTRSAPTRRRSWPAVSRWRWVSGPSSRTWPSSSCSTRWPRTGRDGYRCGGWPSAWPARRSPPGGGTPVHPVDGLYTVGVETALFGGPVLLAWLLGDSARWRRGYYQALEEKAARLERERDAQALVAAAAERARIAREIHDVVAHNVSVMVVQADGAAFALDGSPQRAREALGAISATGRRALAEMRSLLGVLRDPASRDVDLAAGPELGPAAGHRRARRVARAGPRGRAAGVAHGLRGAQAGARGRGAGRLPGRAGVADQRRASTPGPGRRPR